MSAADVYGKFISLDADAESSLTQDKGLGDGNDKKEKNCLFAVYTKSNRNSMHDYNYSCGIFHFVIVSIKITKLC